MELWGKLQRPNISCWRGGESGEEAGVGDTVLARWFGQYYDAVVQGVSSK